MATVRMWEVRDRLISQSLLSTIEEISLFNDKKEFSDRCFERTDSIFNCFARQQIMRESSGKCSTSILEYIPRYC